MQYLFITPWKLAAGPSKIWADELLQRISRFSNASIIAPARAPDSEKAIEQFLIKECEKSFRTGDSFFFSTNADKTTPASVLRLS